MASPPESPYQVLDASLRETLERSYQARVARAPGCAWLLDDGTRLAPEDEAGWNIANGFWSASPTSAWQAAASAGAEWVNQLVRVHERMKAIDPTLGLWRQIKYVRNGWWGGSGGFKVVYGDPAEMRARLDALAHSAGGNRVARDQLFGSLEHQLAGSVKVLTGKLLAAPLDLLDRCAAPPDAHTWREVDRPGREGLHFCVGHEPAGEAGARHMKLDDIHLDWESPVSGVDARGRCKYSGVVKNFRHWAQAMLQVSPPTFWFHDTDRLLTALHAPGRPLPPSAASEHEALRAEWESRKLGLAVRGRAGLALAASYHSRATALMKRRPPAP